MKISPDILNILYTLYVKFVELLLILDPCDWSLPDHQLKVDKLSIDQSLIVNNWPINWLFPLTDWLLILTIDPSLTTD